MLLVGCEGGPLPFSSGLEIIAKGSAHGCDIGDCLLRAEHVVMAYHRKEVHANSLVGC